MPIQAVYDDLASVPEKHRELFTERDGKFVIDVTGAVLDEDVRKLRSALESERKTASEAHRKLKPWSDLNSLFDGKDTDPETVRAIIEESRQLKKDLEAISTNEKKAVDVAVAERVRDLEEKMRSEISKREVMITDATARADKFEGIYRSGLFRNALEKAVGELAHSTAIPDIVHRAELFGWKLDDEGNMIAVDKKGDPIYSKRDPRQPIDLAEWIQDIAIREAPHAFKASSGTGDRSGRAGTAASRNRSKMTAKEKSDFISAYGLSEFQKLPN